MPWEAKVAAATTAAEILSRYALWGKRMIDLEPASSLWGTVVLALSDEVRGFVLVLLHFASRLKPFGCIISPETGYSGHALVMTPKRMPPARPAAMHGANTQAILLNELLHKVMRLYGARQPS